MKYAFIQSRDWIIAQFAFSVIGLVRLLPAETALNFVEKASGFIGPLIPRNRHGLENLRMAFPEKSETERRKILKESWQNLGRTSAEYIYLDQIFDLKNPGSDFERVQFSNIEIFEKLRDDGKPALIFAAHLANWELLPVCAAKYGLKVQALFRAPNNKFIAKKLANMRGGVMDGLVSSGPGSAFQLSASLKNGEHVGLLVDQKFFRGIRVDYFGRPALTNPLLAKLLRSCDCPVHGARTIRMPNGRFHLEITDEISIPKDSNGEVDIHATTQKITNIVEGWVREYPEQWLWVHKRWQGGKS